jgi:hypothetical protein
MPDLLEPITSAAPPPRRLSEDFRELLREAAGRDVTLGELERRLQGRGFALFIMVLSVPFCFPVSIPALSIPFGVVIMLLGVRIMLGRKPELPGFILRKEIKHRVLERIVGFGLKLCLRLERIARPRCQIAVLGPAQYLIGLGLASGGLQLLLPLPPLIPLSNTIPAVSVVLMTAGMIERDGLFVLGGYLVNIAAWVYFAVMFGSLGLLLEKLWAWLA